MNQSGRVGDEAKKRKSPAKSGRVGITDISKQTNEMFTQCILFESQIYGICLNLIMIMFSVFRATASTRMNNASSRSHAIFTIKFTQVRIAFNETYRILKM